MPASGGERVTARRRHGPRPRVHHLSREGDAMHEVVHRWADGYGATIELTAVTYDDVPYAHLVAEAHVVRGDDLHHLTTAPADVMVDADDLRALAAAATAMADHLDAIGGGR